MHHTSHRQRPAQFSGSQTPAEGQRAVDLRRLGQWAVFLGSQATTAMHSCFQMVWTHLQLDLPIKRWLWTWNKWNYNMGRNHISFKLVFMSNLNLEMLVFVEGAKAKNSEQDKTQQQIQPTLVTWPESNRLSIIAGRRVLLLLRHPCSSMLRKQPFWTVIYLLQRSFVSFFSLQGI